MKTSRAFPLLPGMLLLALQALPAAAQNKATLNFVSTAVNVAAYLMPGSINGYTAIYIDPVTWTAAMTDSNLGPFLATQVGMSSRSAACVFSANNSRAVCVYFDDEQAYGVIALKSDAGHPFTAAAAASAYQPTTPQMLQRAQTKAIYSSRAITLDDGQQLSAYSIQVDAKAGR